MQKPMVGFELIDNVHVSRETQRKFTTFETSYLNVRSKEERVLSIKEIRRLPFPAKDHPDYKLWKLRRKNIQRLITYLTSKGQSLTILDVGCGNGFFPHLLSEKKFKVTAVDVNFTELKMAAKAFDNSGVKWYLLDLLAETPPPGKFDIITFCASFQYFENAELLIARCKELLNDGGEIHIIDTPFYSDDEKIKAKENSLAYYKKMGTEQMASFYYHQTWGSLTNYNYIIKYKPSKFFTRILNESPFTWLMIKK